MQGFIQASYRRRAGIVTLDVMVSSPSMRMHLCRCRNGIVALITMVPLPLRMCRRLLVVEDDVDGMTGDNNKDDNGTMGNDLNDDGDGTMGNDIDGDCNGATRCNNKDNGNGR